MKPGWKTTEFYMKAAAVVVGLVLASGIFEPESCSGNWCGVVLRVAGLVAATLGSFGYTYVRNKSKTIN